MFQPSGVAPTASPAAGGSTRPCPYCGTWNQADYAFCQKCGRSLPSFTGPASPAPASAPPPPPSSSTLFASSVPSQSPAPAGAQDVPVVDRPLTEAEKGLLLRRVKSGGRSIARFFGAFLGLVPLVMVATAVMGTPYVPENYIAIVLVSGFLGLILSGVSRSLRTPLVRAARSGTAHEVYGVPEVQAAAGNSSVVSLSGLTFRMKGSDAAALLPNRMNRLTFADGGPTTGARRQFGGAIAFLLESNGVVAARPPMCYLVAESGPEATAAAPLGRKKSGRR